MLKVLKNNGFASFVEVVISSIIFVTAAFGMMSTINTLRAQSPESLEKMEAAFESRAKLEKLQRLINAESWNNANSEIAVGTHSSVDGNYTYNWTVTSESEFLRKIELTITYPD